MAKPKHRASAKAWHRPQIGLEVSKKDVARRELATAIRLYMANADPIAVHVLASAASRILNDIGKSTGVRTSRLATLDYIKEEHHADFEYHIDEWYNFMKHGSRDHSRTTWFNPDINRPLLALSCIDYVSIFTTSFFELAVFFVILAQENPNYFKPGFENYLGIGMEAFKAMGGRTVINRDSALEVLDYYDKVLVESPELNSLI